MLFFFSDFRGIYVCLRGICVKMFTVTAFVRVEKLEVVLLFSFRRMKKEIGVFGMRS